MRRRTFLGAAGLTALAGCAAPWRGGDSNEPAGEESPERPPFEGDETRLADLGRWFAPFDRSVADSTDSYLGSVTRPTRIQAAADELGSQATSLQQDVPSDLPIESRSADRVITVEPDAPWDSVWEYVVIDRALDLATVEASVSEVGHIERSTVGNYTLMALESGYWLGVGDERLIAVQTVGGHIADNRGSAEELIQTIGGASEPLSDQIDAVRTVADRTPTGMFTGLIVRTTPAHEVLDRAERTFRGWTVKCRSVDVGADRYGERHVLYFPELDRGSIDSELSDFRAVSRREGWDATVAADGAIGTVTRTIEFEQLPF